MHRAAARIARAVTHALRLVAHEHAVGEHGVAVVLRGRTAMRAPPSATVARGDRGVVGEGATRVARRDAEHRAGATPRRAVVVVTRRSRFIAGETAICEVQLRAALGIHSAASMIATALRDVVGEGAVGEGARAAGKPDGAAACCVGATVQELCAFDGEGRGCARRNRTTRVAAHTILEAAAGDRQPSACDCANRSAKVRRRCISHDRVDDAEAASFMVDEAAV